jgi:hypothetical protein
VGIERRGEGEADRLPALRTAFLGEADQPATGVEIDQA